MEDQIIINGANNSLIGHKIINDPKQVCISLNTDLEFKVLAYMNNKLIEKLIEDLQKLNHV